MLYCVDDDGHCVRRCTPGGELLATYGTRGQPAPLHGGQPFNRPTKVAFDPASGDLYISDGYGNARVHKFTVDGEHLFSWGEYGTDPGQFNLPHSVCTDDDGTVYVADRESHRVQRFDDRGMYLDQWNDLHRPCGLHVADGLVYIGQIVTELTVNADYPNLGCCVSVHDLSGRRLARLGNARPARDRASSSPRTGWRSTPTATSTSARSPGPRMAESRPRRARSAASASWCDSDKRFDTADPGCIASLASARIRSSMPGWIRASAPISTARR